MEDIFKQTSSSDYEQKVDLSYALGKAYEDIKDFNNAFRFYEKANNLKFPYIDFLRIICVNFLI